MSADNWTYCPKCTKKAIESQIAFEKKVAASYGKVSSFEYLALVNKLNCSAEVEKECTLREDYVLGIVENKFCVSYTASCSACNFTYVFKEEREINLTEEKQ